MVSKHGSQKAKQKNKVHGQSTWWERLTCEFFLFSFFPLFSFLSFFFLRSPFHSSHTHYPLPMTTPQEIFKALAAIPTYSGATILPNSTDNTLSMMLI